MHKQIVDLIQNGEWSPATRKRSICQEWIIQTKHNVLYRDEMLMLMMMQGKKFTLDLERAQEYISWIIERECITMRKNSISHLLSFINETGSR